LVILAAPLPWSSVSARPPAHPKTEAPAVAKKPADPARAQLARRLDHLRSKGVLDRGVTAVYVAYARSGNRLYAAHPRRKLNPASNVKLVSTATALAILGPRWRYVTLVLGKPPSSTGPSAGRIEGGLRMMGSGDPTLDEEALGALAARLKERGVRLVEGDVQVGRRILVQIEDDDSELWSRCGAGARAMTRAANRATARAANPGEVKPSAAGPALRPGEDCTTIALGEALREAGVAVTGRVRRPPRSWLRPRRRADDRELARHQSAPLSDLLVDINHPSDNRLAEAVLRTASAVLFGGRPTRRKGVRAMRWWLRRIARLPLGTIRLENGSGLSTRSRMSPRQIARVLRVALGYRASSRDLSSTRKARIRRDAKVYHASLPRAGRDGTLQYRFRGSAARRYVRAKTGTLNGIITLSGVITPPGGRPVVFSILSNGIRHDERYFVRRRHQKMVEAIYRYLTP
jgi:D-alanyl-D-alanine carboxypeptidase/D-alanyl-D-alanine-endopeptidase (penicillin-binding protein 4)